MSASSDQFDFPEAQYLAPEVVLVELAEAGAHRATSLKTSQVLILSMLAGGFIGVGALFSTLIATGTENEGVKKLLEGFGFSVGFFLVVLSGALLFTEVNVELPATLLSHDKGLPHLRSAVVRLWALAAVGNMIGAFVFETSSRSRRTLGQNLMRCSLRLLIARSGLAKLGESRVSFGPWCRGLWPTGLSAWRRFWPRWAGALLASTYPY